MTSDTVALTAAYSLSLLSEYTHTLDTLPLDLSKQFADLRELDAVLSASMHTITAKVNRLIDMIEHDTQPKESRLWLLAEIAEEAQRLKLGGEDKIRVASQAADGLKGHHDHLANLLQHIPNFDTSVLQRKTVYPHVAPRSYAPTSMYEGGRRRRGALLNGSSGDQTPAKKRRIARDDDIEGSVSRTPRGDRVGDSSAPQRPKNGSRARKNDRMPSPAESVLSVISHQPPQSLPVSRITSRLVPTNKRARPSVDPSAPKDIPNAPPAASHPSLPPPYASASTFSGPGWSGPVHAQLQGPGMPVARNVVPTSAILIGPGVEGTAHIQSGGEGEEADDGKLYCWCNGPSHGVMIACDDAECEKEWFHLGCIGLEVLPKGAWYCDTCKGKKKNQRGGRGTKRRSGGGRSGARVASAASTA